MEDLHNVLNICIKQLAILENQNIALKTQLAHILKYHFDRSLLETLEYFHTAFLQQDTRFEALRSEISLQQTWLGQPYTDTVNKDNIYRHQQHIYEKLGQMEKDVQRLMSVFNDYLQVHFSNIALNIPSTINKL
ncbi:hypothetical protein SAMN05518672_102424 [Chitinophaga sp. CF118]|uniref:hypothetical protein n=1 Tax=Chitinophaga sp. CF118 TaxID=1884367 RepID=UPI0008EBAEC3|nr:hypothetical protein [Chitinophaga sp. CF118]SFD56068.1 hypothetical protein SAMN05518672_102424 [Chitinophaga sp. CF118]